MISIMYSPLLEHASTHTAFTQWSNGRKWDIDYLLGTVHVPSKYGQVSGQKSFNIKHHDIFTNHSSTNICVKHPKCL